MLTLVRGLPGSGKSTYARKLAAQTGCLHHETDRYFIVNGIYQFNYAELAVAHRWCLNTARSLLEVKSDVVVSNTFVKLWELEKYIEVANELNCQFRVHSMPLEVNYGSSHNLPEGTLERMRSNWEIL